MKRALTFDDVALVPQYNNIDSRTEPDLSTWLTKNIRMKMPILAANMDTVIGDLLADELIRLGGFPIFHRFTTDIKQQQWAEKYCANGKAALSVGLAIPEAVCGVLDAGIVRVVCVDIAHGHSKKMLEQISWMKKRWPGLDIIAGNVCTAIAYQDLVNAGADAVKVGIGPGAACTTRMVTGFGVPQFTTIQECNEIAKKLRVPLIADGGIRNSRDVSLALAAGASTVMIGKLFAMTYESAAPKYFAVDSKGNHKCYSSYRGQASKEFQIQFYGKLKTGTVPEGESMQTVITKSAEDVINELLGGVRSAMTYGGARSLKEFQNKVEFVEVTRNYLSESNIRPI